MSLYIIYIYNIIYIVADLEIEYVTFWNFETAPSRRLRQEVPELNLVLHINSLV